MRNKKVKERATLRRLQAHTHRHTQCVKQDHCNCVIGAKFSLCAVTYCILNLSVKKCIKITHLDLWSQSLKYDLLLFNFKYTSGSSPILIIACKFRFEKLNSLRQGALCESNLYWMWIGHYNTGILFDFVLKCTSSHYCPLSACMSLYVYFLLPKASYCSV